MRAAVVSRRALVGGLAFAGMTLPGAFVGALTTRGPTMTCAYVGCRTSRERNAKGDGLGVWHIDQGGAWTQIQLIPDLVNPSYLALDRAKRFLYTVHGDRDEASSFAIDKATGRLSFINTVKTGGWNPVYLMADPTNRFMVIANHVVKDGIRSGIASLPIEPDGRLADPVDVVSFVGKAGPHRTEQPFPKPHQVQFDRTGRLIAVPDKGSDMVRLFTLDAGGKLHELGGSSSRETAGPRHIVFHPSNRFAYVVNELDSTVVSYRFESAIGTLIPFQNLLCIPAEFNGNSRASEITVSADGRFVYASARGNDEVAIFAVNPGTGHLAAKGWVSAVGRTPRFITLSTDGEAMFVANEESHEIVGYAVSASTGLLDRPVTVARTGSPTCILFA